MVVTLFPLEPWMRLLQRLLAVCLLAAPLGALAQVPLVQTVESQLSDAWVTTLQQDELQQSEQSLAWSHAFALRHSTAAKLESQRTRLIHELNALQLGARVVGNAALTAGLDAWRSALEEAPALPGRSPGRHDLPWLGANLRHDPPISSLRHWGYCEVPNWVEIWHHSGVSRLTWRSGMMLDQALSALPKSAYRSAERAVVIAPNGEQTSRGISAWNHQATPLSPGGRVVLALPTIGERTLSASVRREATLVNQRLPEYLATRLPGEACRLHSAEGEL